jgi:hypothetical protein
MHKIIVFLRARSDFPRAGFQQEVLDRAYRQQERAALGDAMVVNLVRLPFANLPYRPPSDPTAGQAPEYDVIIEHCSRRSHADMLCALRELVLPSGSVEHAYAVTPTVIYDRGRLQRGRPSPGIKLMGRLMFHADMPDPAVRRSWGLHAALAARVHVGSAFYEQNWVDAVLGDDCPATRGIPVMHFGSEPDFFERFVDSPRGMEEIIQDTSHFVAGGPRFYTTEYTMGETP